MDWHTLEKDGSWGKYAYKSKVFVICKMPHYQTKWMCGLYNSSDPIEGFKSKKEAKKWIEDHYYDF